MGQLPEIKLMMMIVISYWESGLMESSRRRTGAGDWETHLLTTPRTAEKPHLCFRGRPWLCKGETRSLS